MCGSCFVHPDRGPKIPSVLNTYCMCDMLYHSFTETLSIHKALILASEAVNITVSVKITMTIINT